MVKSAFVFPAMQDFGVTHGIDTAMYKFDKSMTRQEFAEECDINTLMARYEAGGAITHVNKAQPIYMDVASMPDLRASLDIMREASLAFASLPAVVRREFDNDPQKFVDFAQTPENLPRMREWGLAPALPSPVEPQLVRVVPEPTPTEPPLTSGGKK